jgi:predicted NBD/HSP70 family sugar kinase
MSKIADQWLRDILRTLYQRRDLTRSEIIQATGLNPASVSHALRYMLRAGAVVKVGDLQSSGGRKPEVLNLNGEAAYFVGVDLEGHRIRFGLASLIGDIRYRWEYDLEIGHPLDSDKLFEGIRKVLKYLDSRQMARVLAIGVSYPGLLDQQGRLTAVNLGWNKFPLVAELREKASKQLPVELPVFFESDRHSCVRAERWLGCGQQYNDGLYVISERGIGTGFFLEGRAVEGFRDMAGELGHCVIEPAAEDRCNCGKKGCLESIASSDNIVRQYLDKVGRPRFREKMTIHGVYERARRKDEAALAVLARAGKAWGLALSYVVNLLNPEIIILGGDLISGEDVLVPLIKEEIGRHALPELIGGLKIVVSGLGFDIRLKGACSLAFRKSIADPHLLKKMCLPVFAGPTREADRLDAVPSLP